jgi:hypothetical protein
MPFEGKFPKFGVIQHQRHRAAFFLRGGKNPSRVQVFLWPANTPVRITYRDSLVQIVARALPMAGQPLSAAQRTALAAGAAAAAGLHTARRRAAPPVRPRRPGPPLADPASPPGVCLPFAPGLTNADELCQGGIEITVSQLLFE